MPDEIFVNNGSNIFVEKRDYIRLLGCISHKNFCDEKLSCNIDANFFQPGN